MSDLLQDVRYAVRMLAKSPMVSTVAALSLALGIAATASMGALAGSFLWASLPYEDPDQLMILWEANVSREITQAPTSAETFLDWRRGSEGFQALEAYRTEAVNVASPEAPPEQLTVLSGTPGFVDILGVRPLLGRAFTTGEGRQGATGVVLLSHDVWRERFAGSPDVLGAVMELDGTPHTIVGILPEEFEMVPAGVDLFRPLALETLRGDRDERAFLAMGRLRPGITPEQAQAELDPVQRRLQAEFPGSMEGWAVAVTPLRETFPGPTDTRLVQILVAVSLFGLLIACANVANLLLGRAEVRQREVAVRTALGAGRGRILRQLLTESVVLALVGGVLGVVGAIWIVGVLQSAMPPVVPQAFHPRLTVPVLGAVTCVTLLAGILFGLAPALHAARGDLRGALGEGSRGGTVGGRRKRLRQVLVVGEFAVALGLLTGAGLLFQAFEELAGGDPGFRPEGLLTFQIVLPAAAYPDDEEVTRFLPLLMERLGAVPEVEGVAAMSTLPRSRGNPVSSFRLPGQEGEEEGRLPRTSFQVVSSGYLETLEVELASGRFIREADRAETPRVAVINQAMADRFFPGVDPLGQRIHLGRNADADAPDGLEVVGVVGNVAQDRLSMDSRPPTVVYLAAAQSPRRSLAFALRTRIEPGAAAAAVRAAVAELDPSLPLGGMQTMEEHIAAELSGPRVLGIFLVAMGIAALLLAAMGIYGVMAHHVVSRTREIGIRMAMGADRRRVLGMVGRHGMSMVGVGMLVGLPLSYLMFVAARGTLEGLTDVINPAVPFAISAAGLVGVAIVACLLPGVRASRLEPVAALREE